MAEMDLLTENTMCGVVAVRPLPYHSKAILPSCSTRNPSVSVCGSIRPMVHALPSASLNARSLRSPGARGKCDPLPEAAIGATGRMSDTFWNAHRIQGERRQFASVTVLFML